MSTGGSRVRSHGALEDVAANDPSMISLPPEAEQVYDVWEVRRAVDGAARRRT